MKGARDHRSLQLSQVSERHFRPEAGASRPRVVGRYVLLGEIGSGGSATVHLGRLVSEGGFSRTVAVKRLLSEHSADPEFVAMFLDEARVVARIHHPNVVQSLDVFWSDVDGRRELFMVMEYVAGETLVRLIAKYASRGEAPPVRVVLAIICDILRGLHAAHNANSVNGEPLELVHRDVSPQNVIVGVHGSARLLDFGIAKATGRVHTTRQGDFKGKAAYMAPEQILGSATKLSDVYAASVVLWEALTAQRLFKGENDAAVLHKVMTSDVPRPSTIVPGIPPGIDAVIMRGLARDPNRRFADAQDMAEAIEKITAVASPSEVSAWVRREAHDELKERAAQVAIIEGLEASALMRLNEAVSAMRATPVDVITRVERAEPRTSIAGPRTRRPTALAWTVFVSLATLILGGTFLSLRVKGADPDGPLSGSADSFAAQAPATSAPIATPSPASVVLAPELASERTPPGVSSGTGSLMPPRAQVRALPRPGGSSRLPRPACLPPFLVDSAGRTHFKTECL